MNPMTRAILETWTDLLWPTATDILQGLDPESRETMLDLLRSCGGPGLLMLDNDQLEAASAFVIIAMLECGKRTQDALNADVEFEEWKP